MEISRRGPRLQWGQASGDDPFRQRQRGNSQLLQERPSQTILGAAQKAWFLERLMNSKAVWKIWGNTTATLDMRGDPQIFLKE